MSMIINSYAFGVVAPSPIAWYDAGAVVGLVDGDPVTTWADSSGNSRDLTQSTAGMKPTYQTNEVNGLPIVRFDGTDDELRSASFAYSQPCDIFIVIKRYNTDFKYILSSLAGFGVAVAQVTGGPGVFLYAGSAADPLGSSTTASFYVINAHFDGASSKIYENGVATSAGNPGSNNGDGLVLGNRYDSALPSQVDVAELKLFAPALDSSARSAEESALRTKYGL
jgi:hypothetical protein